MRQPTAKYPRLTATGTAVWLDSRAIPGSQGAGPRPSDATRRVATPGGRVGDRAANPACAESFMVEKCLCWVIMADGSWRNLTGLPTPTGEGGARGKFSHGIALTTGRKLRSEASTASGWWQNPTERATGTAAGLGHGRNGPSTIPAEGLRSKVTTTNTWWRSRTGP